MARPSESSVTVSVRVRLSSRQYVILKDFMDRYGLTINELAKMSMLYFVGARLVRSYTSHGVRIRGLRQLLICENCGYKMAELAFTNGVSVYQKAEMLRYLGVRCPRCGSESLSLVITGDEDEKEKGEAAVIRNE